MDVGRSPGANVPEIAAAIGASARARMLYVLMDGRPRTSTELALIADVTPSTASTHLRHLEVRRLVSVSSQGRQRYYALAGADVATVLEALSVLAHGSPATASAVSGQLRGARSCYASTRARGGRRTGPASRHRVTRRILRACSAPRSSPGSCRGARGRSRSCPSRACESSSRCACVRRG